MAGKTRAELERERDLLQGETAKLKRELEALTGGEKMVKASDVIRVAREAAEDQGWCTQGVTDALAELGIDYEPSKWDVVLTVYLTYAPGEITDDDPDYVRDIATETERYATRMIGSAMAEVEITEIALASAEQQAK